MDETGAYYTEWSKPERKTPIQYTNAYIWNLKNGNNNPVYETAKETLMYRTFFWTLWERERVGWFGWMHWNMYNIIYETSCQSRFEARYWMLGAGALGWPRGMVQGGRREEGSRWGTRVYLWWIHFDIWQNEYNIVKLKNKIKLKK